MFSRESSEVQSQSVGVKGLRTHGSTGRTHRQHRMMSHWDIRYIVVRPQLCVCCASTLEAPRWSVCSSSICFGRSLERDSICAMLWAPCVTERASFGLTLVSSGSFPLDLCYSWSNISKTRWNPTEARSKPTKTSTNLSTTCSNNQHLNKTCRYKLNSDVKDAEDEL